MSENPGYGDSDVTPEENIPDDYKIDKGSFSIPSRL